MNNLFQTCTGPVGPKGEKGDVGPIAILPRTIFPEMVNTITNYVDSVKETSVSKSLAVGYGKVLTGENYKYFASEYKDGTPQNDNTLFIWMSMTKVLSFCKALEDGIVSYDDEIRTYLPQFDASNLKVWNGPDSELVECSSQITVRHVAEMCVGFTYTIGQQDYLDNEPSNFVEYLRKYHSPLGPGGIGDLERGYLERGYLGYPDAYINWLSYIPLKNQPGEGNDYGPEFSLLGAVISASLRQKGLYTGSFVNYCQERILIHAGIEFFFGQGQMDLPDNFNERLADIQIFPSEFTYGTRDANATYSGNSWLSDAPNDSLAILVESYTRPYNPHLLYVGNFGWGGVSTLENYSKILRLTLNNGVGDNGVRVLGIASSQWFYNLFNKQSDEDY